MKKRITQILFSLLTFCTNTDIYAQENEKKIKNSWSSSVSLNYDFTNNFTGNVNLGYTQKNWELFLDYSGHSDRIEISSELFRFFFDRNISTTRNRTAPFKPFHRPPTRHATFLARSIPMESQLQFPKITTKPGHK